MIKKACLELALKKYPDKPVITLSHDASKKPASNWVLKSGKKALLIPNYGNFAFNAKRLKIFPIVNVSG